MKEHKWMGWGRIVVWMAPLVALAGCQVLFGVELPAEDVAGAGAAGSTAGGGGQAGAARCNLCGAFFDGAPTSAACVDNGPPTSFALATALTGCLCRADTCGSTDCKAVCETNAAPSQACKACSIVACEAEANACLIDDGKGDASGGGGQGGVGNAGNAGNAGSGGGTCTAPKVTCGDECLDPKTGNDAANCGVCGRSCLGATCKSGACVPEVMAQNEVAPYALVDDGTYLYWVSPAIKGAVNDSRMRRVAKANAGGGAENVLDGVRVRARSLGFAQGKLYWGELGASPADGNQRILSAAPADAGPQLIQGAQFNVQHLALMGDKIYWTVPNDAAVRGKAANGTGDVVPNVAGQSSVGWLAVDDEANPYWLAGVPREVRRVAVSPENTAEKVADSANGVAVELAGGRVYWADGAVVRSAAKTETVPATGRDEFSGHGRVEGFRVEVAGGGGAGGAAGAAALYVLTTSEQKLQAWRKGPNDDAPLLLGEVEAKAEAYAGNPFGAAYVLTDEQYVYFADVGTVDTSQVVPVSQGDGVVYRVAK